LIEPPAKGTGKVPLLPQTGHSMTEGVEAVLPASADPGAAWTQPHCRHLILPA
jgi:hypothetical protein